MALALDASTPAAVSTSVADSITTASFTPPAGAVLVAIGVHDTSSANTTNTSAVTDSAGLTWTIRATRNKADSGGQPGHTQVSTAVVSSSAAMTVTTTGTNTNGACGLRVLVFTGADTTTPLDVITEGSSISTISVSMTTVTDGAWPWVGNEDWSLSAVPTAGSGVTTDTGLTVSGALTFWVAKANTVKSPAGSVTLTSTAPSSGTQNNFIGFAVKPASGGGGTTHNATVTMAGTGGLTASGTLTAAATTTLTGTGGLTATAAVDRPTTTTFAGTGSLSGTGALTLPASTTFAGTGSLSAAGTVDRPASTTLDATGALTSAATVAGAGASQLSGVGGLTAAPAVTRPAAATFAGTGGLSAVATVVPPAGRITFRPNTGITIRPFTGTTARP